MAMTRFLNLSLLTQQFLLRRIAKPTVNRIMTEEELDRAAGEIKCCKPLVPLVPLVVVSADRLVDQAN